jgi:hypothetical protein
MEVVLTVNTGVLQNKLYTYQQFYEAIMNLTTWNIAGDYSLIKRSSTIPTSNEGVLFYYNGNTTIAYDWNENTASYQPITLTDGQKGYWVGETQPANPNDFKVWFKVNGDNKLIGLYSYVSGVWNLGVYGKDAIDTFFEGETAGGKKKVSYNSLTDVPTVFNTNVNVTNLKGSDLNTTQLYFHTGINGIIVWNAALSEWTTADGTRGTIKAVDNVTLGNETDFFNGIFNTALGANPGWYQDVIMNGKVIVGADPTDTWNGTLPLNPNTTFGEKEHLLTSDEQGDLDLSITQEPSDTTGGGRSFTSMTVNGTLLSAYDAGTFTETASANNALEAHNNMQPSVARYFLRKR